jgi:RNA polymerase sigma-70 factor (ECF subfamily)
LTDNTLDRLAEGVRRHDPAALAVLLELQRAALLAFVGQRLGSTRRGKLAAEDVLQELAVKAVRDLPQTDLGDRDPFAWLCHLAEQCIVDRHFAADKSAAGRKVPGNVPAGEGSEDLIALLAVCGTTPSRAALRDERRRRLRVAIASLPDAHQEALRLRYGEGLPTKEVAHRLNKTDVATRVLLARLVRRLQELLGPAEGPEPGP